MPHIARAYCMYIQKQASAQMQHHWWRTEWMTYGVAALVIVLVRQALFPAVYQIGADPPPHAL